MLQQFYPKEIDQYYETNIPWIDEDQNNTYKIVQILKNMRNYTR